MEVGRRSLSSENEFRERRRSFGKKMGALPLAMLLSFNEKGVHPDCPNVSNPYHKCGRHCLGEIPSGGDFLGVIRSDGDQEWEKKSDNKGVNPNCSHASNPYHKCAEYCFDKLSEKRQDAGKDQPAMRFKGSKVGEKVLGTTERTELYPHCRDASNPTHECTESCFQSVTARNLAEGEKPEGVFNKTNKNCAHLNRNASSLNKVTENCFEDTPKKEHLKGAEKPKEESEIISIVEQRVDLEDNNASNLSHVCFEYCSESVLERDRHEEAIRLKRTKEGDKLLDNRQRNRFDSQCKHASMLHHECIESCLKITPDRNLAEGEIFEGVRMETDKRVHSSPKHASSPYNKVTEYYFEDTYEKEQHEGAKKPKEESEMVSIAEQRVNLECKSASNPDHVCAEYCFQSVPVREQHGQTMKPKEERIVVTAKRGVHLVCKYSSNPYHECNEYCFQSPLIGKGFIKSKETKEVIVPLEKVNPQCQHASNPYHVCAENCFQNVSNGHHPRRSMMKSKQEKKVVASPQVVNLGCKNASNPYHACAEYCFENVLEKDPPKQTIEKLKEADTLVLPSERGVSPECKFASNPYHVCAEYCFQNALKWEQHGQFMKPKSLKQLKNLVSNKKITSGHPQCEYAANPYHQCAEYCLNKNIPGSKTPDGAVKTNERKKEVSYAPRRDDNPKYKNALNSFHRCVEYFPEEISPKNEAVEGSTATVKVKKRNSSEEKKINHSIVERISLNSKYMEALKPSHHFIESSEGINLQDGTEDRCMDFKYVEAFIPTNDNFNINNGISKMYMQNGTKDSQSAKVLDLNNPEEPRGALPLHVDASDLFHEWSKYCSQTNEIVKQDNKVGMGEFTARNGKGNGTLKDYDSANMEKVQATWGFLRSLPISLLFLLGFLLALLHWTQVIHSLVMSSEKNEEPERMKHERHLDPKCKEAYDPYHTCAHYCFPGAGEERH